MDFTNYIETELFVLVPVLYILGMMIKKSSINDRWIPIILGVMGIILATIYNLSAHMPLGAENVFSVIFASFTQGILCASGSVYANNIVKQLKKDDGKNENGNESNIQDDNQNDNVIR